MVHNLAHNLCASLVENIGGVSGATPHKAAVATPVITLTGNSVTIICDTTGATIYYTLDGSTPTSSSSQYSSAFTLDSSCTIKAIAIKGGKSSAVAEESYVKPIIYLTQWKLMGNSEVHGNEIWSCGEYSAVDNKWHIRILPEGYGVIDIALDEPLRMTNDVADSIEFADSATIVTRNIAKTIWNNLEVKNETVGANSYMRFYTSSLKNVIHIPSVWQERVLCCMSADFVQNAAPLNLSDSIDQCMCVNKYNESSAYIYIRDTSVNNVAEFKAKYGTHEFLYRLKTPTTEVIQVPQIQEADSYTCVISQGAKAVEWSSFETN